MTVPPEFQEPPVPSEENLVIQGRLVRRIVLAGFDSRETAKAYFAWLESGAAHEAFREWFGEQ